MEFSDEEMKLLEEALTQRMCFLETGVGHLSYPDMQRMEKHEMAIAGVRMPSLEQLEEAKRYRALRERLLSRRTR